MLSLSFSAMQKGNDIGEGGRGGGCLDGVLRVKQLVDETMVFVLLGWLVAWLIGGLSMQAGYDLSLERTEDERMKFLSGVFD